MNSAGTRQEREFLISFNGVVEKCKQHLISVKGELGQDELTKWGLAGLASCLYLGKKEKRTVDGKVSFFHTQKDDPTLYAKVRMWDEKVWKYVLDAWGLACRQYWQARGAGAPTKPPQQKVPR